MAAPLTALEVIYQNQLGRAPDEEGRAFYRSLLDAGTLDVDAIRRDIDQSKEGRAFDLANAPEPKDSGIRGMMDEAANLARRGSEGYTPSQAEVTTIAEQDLSKYLNPYTQNVIDTTMGQLGRQNEILQNQNDAAAAAAGAFGGSRHGVLGAETNRGYLDQVADTSGMLNQANFQNALNVAGQDVNSLNNMGQFNTNALNQGAQFNVNSLFKGSGALSNIAGKNFAMQNTANQNLMNQGGMQQDAMQQLIDSIKGQTQGTFNQPNVAAGGPLSALGMLPGQGGSTTSSSSPGLFGLLSGGASILSASDINLKESIKPIGNVKGINLYSWDWNDEGKRVADPDQPRVGVMAQELQETHPDLVHKGADGYLRVDYNGLADRVA